MKGDLKCPECKSSQTRFRIKTNDRVCYVCGNAWQVKNEEVENGSS